MNRILSGKRVGEILGQIDAEKECAIQDWIDNEMADLKSKYLGTQNIKLTLVDNVNGDGVCSHCGNYNIRFMAVFVDTKSSDTYKIALSDNCLQSHLQSLTEADIVMFQSEVKAVIKMRNSVLIKLAGSDYREVKYPHALRVNSKLEPLILNKLPVPDMYFSEVRLAVNTQRALHEKTTYYMHNQKYIRYVRLSLKLQPYSSFLLSINDKMKRCERLSPSILEALERGMTDGWETRLQESIVIKDVNKDVMIEYEKRLDRLLLCRCGFTRSTIVSFRKQLRNGKPLSDRQVEVLVEWEEKFSKQLEQLESNNQVSGSLVANKV